MTPIFEAQVLKKSFGGLPVTQNVSFSMQAGDRLALIGPNGAGKTTLVNIVTGHLAPDSGTVSLGGENISRYTPTQRVGKGLVRSFQVTRLFADMTAEEHIALAILQRLRISGRMVGHYRNMPFVMAEVKQHLETLGIAHVANKEVSDMAYGQQRLLEIALALALKPNVLLLDEPAAGVPSTDTQRIEDALAAFPQELAVLMIDHDLDLVFRFANRVIVLAAGAIIFDGLPQDVVKDARVREAYLGGYVA